jgi:uncharacterized protein (TIGR03083 family)
MSIVVTPVGQVPALGRAEAAVVAATENERFVSLLAALRPDDWSKRTDCPAWDVRALASHVLGGMEGNVSFPTFIHQFRAGKKAAGDRPSIDGMTEVQVRERNHLGPAELLAGLADLAPRAARARKRLPGLLRHLPMQVEVENVMEKWSLGFLFDIIFTRDTWMHRVDIARATGHPLELTAEHDGRIIADVVVEWARRHGQPFTLTLLGPAGGTFSDGESGEQITIDAVEFARVLSGRPPSSPALASGLLTQPVPF